MLLLATQCVVRLVTVLVTRLTASVIATVMPVETAALILLISALIVCPLIVQ